MPPNGATLHPHLVPCNNTGKRKKRMLYFLKKRDQVFPEKSKVKKC
jgi:hypothetical protein